MTCNTGLVQVADMAVDAWRFKAQRKSGLGIRKGGNSSDEIIAAHDVFESPFAEGTMSRSVVGSRVLYRGRNGFFFLFFSFQSL